MARAAARRNHHRFGTHWTMRDPLPLFRYCLRAYRAVTRREFSDADPFDLVTVDPRAVTHVSNRAKGWDSWLGEVVGGDWDRRSVPLDEVPIVRIVADYVESGEPLDCDRYRRYYAEESRRTEPFDVRCERLTNLVWDIERDGYRTQRELLECEDLYTLQGENNDTVHPLVNEIRLDIDRDGGFHHWRCGLHRLAIARALGIERVPVLIGTRHAEWQAIRDQFRRASSVDDVPEALWVHADHPDLRGLVPDSRPGRDGDDRSSAVRLGRPTS